MATVYEQLNPLIPGQAYTFYGYVFSQTSPFNVQTTVTLAAGDVTVMRDATSLGNITTLPVESGATGLLTFTLSAAETTGCLRQMSVKLHDVAGGQWSDIVYTVPVMQAVTVNDPTAATIADAVWDEPLTGATHDVATSAGRRLRQLGAASISSGTAQSGTVNTIVLESGEASTTDNIYNECLIAIVAGTGAGQVRMIAEYDGGTLTAIVDREWDVTPAIDSEYQIMAFSGILLTEHGQAQAGTASTITLASTASAVNDVYIGSMIVLTTGTGPGQARLITDYDGTSKIATVTPDWTTTPGATSVYKIIPVGRSIVGSMQADALTASALATDAVTEIATAIWGFTLRTLTQSAAAVTAILEGTTITEQRGDTWSISITGLGSIADYATIDFTIKSSDVADTAAAVRIRKNLSGLNDGLLVLKGSSSVTAANGSITIDDAAAGDITIALKAVDTATLTAGTYNYDIQKINSTGVVTTLSTGTFVLEADVGRATS